MMSTPLHIWTPTLLSRPLSDIAKAQVWLKMECNQPVGSYKIRGIGRLCQYYSRNGISNFVASSGGNGGVAVAYAGRKLDIQVDIFIPETSDPIFISAIESEGAKIHVKGSVWDET